jgi:prophage antirepressor-like protein
MVINNTRCAVDALQKHVNPSWKIKFTYLADKQACMSNLGETPMFHIQADTDLISEPGLYALVFKSKLSAT